MKIIEEVKAELRLSYVPIKPMELAIQKERERILKLIDRPIKVYSKSNEDDTIIAMQSIKLYREDLKEQLNLQTIGGRN